MEKAKTILDEFLLGFLGVRDVTVVTAEGVFMGPEKAAEAVAAAKSEIAEPKSHCRRCALRRPVSGLAFWIEP